jgi:hypothetical protein
MELSLPSLVYHWSCKICKVDVPPHAVVNVQEVALGAGPALLIEDFDEKQATVIWSTSERMYLAYSSFESCTPGISVALSA